MLVAGDGAAAQEGRIQPQEGRIAGVDVGDSGPEAGVWVIAETDDLPTKYAKIVVTDDEGRFVLPELPMVNYHVWVRGYGLRDSDKTYLRPGAHDVTLTVEAAATPAEAAKVYPADHWWALLEPPAKEEFRAAGGDRSEEHTSELQSREKLVCRLLLEKKNRRT